MSWLSFNYRVLMEAENRTVPILERLRFAAIYSSNLDEFFRVRVSDLRSISALNKEKLEEKLGLDTDELLDEIHQEVEEQLNEYGIILKKVIASLRRRKIHIVQDYHEIPEQFHSELRNYFKYHVMGYLIPIMIEKSKKIFLDNQKLYLAITLIQNEKRSHVYLNIPSDKLDRFYAIEDDGNKYYIFLEDIIRLNLDLVFHNYGIVECVSVKLNKDAELHIVDEYSGDLLEKIQKQVSKRNLGTPSRFLYDSRISKELRDILVEKLKLEKEDLVEGGRYHNLNDYWQIQNMGIKSIEYPSLIPVNHKELDSYSSIFEAIYESDQLLHFPFHSYNYVLQFFNESAIDEHVSEIFVTFYRMAKNSIIAEALISAAKIGKKVTAFIELKARFDESNNIHWSSKLKEAGVNVVYSIPGLKVHAKVALVKRKNQDDSTTLYGFYGTGNLNENTAKIYCDYGLLTANKKLNKELENVFLFLSKKKKPEEFNSLIVSQFNAIPQFTGLIDREIKNALEGKKAEIIIKLNNLEEPDIIQKIYEAAEKGVTVKILARSICCLVPDLNGIEVYRLVDRYLEHARIFYFYNDGKEDVFMGSSDWMSRNLHRRVEVTFPLLNEYLKKEVIEVLSLQLNDNTKLVRLSKDMENIKIKPEEPIINAQSHHYQWLLKKNQ